MKEKAPVIILLATTLGLGIFSIVQHNSANARETANTVLHQKQVKEFEGRVSRLVEDLRNNGKELSEKANEVNSLGAKLTASESKINDTGEELENVTKVHDKALRDIVEKNDALKQSRQELLDTKANVAAVEVKLSDKVRELEQATTERAATKKSLDQASAKLADVTTRLTLAGAELAKKTAALVAALKDLEDGQVRIARLETDLQAVNQQVGGLKTQIGSLEEGIEVTRKKLAAAVGDRTFLLRELKRMQDEKSELEKHLNNLEYVRAQYKKLKSEWAASERLRRIREGIGYYAHPNGNVRGVTGLRRIARRDLEPTASAQASGAVAGVSPDQLDVELKSDGTVTIVQPGEEPKVVVPGQPKVPDLSKPSEKEALKPTESTKPKGIVTPALESVLPKLKTKPAVSPAPKPKTPAAKPASTSIESSPKPAAPTAPKPETPASKPAPSETKPPGTPPGSKPKSEKPAPAETKPASKSASPTPKPVPANP